MPLIMVEDLDGGMVSIYESRTLEASFLEGLAQEGLEEKEAAEALIRLEEHSRLRLVVEKARG